MNQEPPRLIILTGAYDDQYLHGRRDNPAICTSAGKRVILYHAIEQAVGSPVVLLSRHPRGRGAIESLPETTSRFGAQTQVFAKASGIRKIRFLLDFIHYARHVARHSRSGDTLVIDNYELIYVLAVYYCRLLGRDNPMLLEYEDGKHLIDKGIWKWMSGLAEWMARPLVKGALLATPTLGERLPPGIPQVLVPGILCDGIIPRPPPAQGQPVGFLYSGSLDRERGVPLLLDYLENGMFVPGTVFHITGHGYFLDRFRALQNRYPELIHFHGSVSQDELSRIRSLCHFGLNLQSASNPISAVTYPSKTFDYLNAGLRVLSTKAAGVEQILGSSAIYLRNESPAGLAEAVHIAIQQPDTTALLGTRSSIENYTLAGTVLRMAKLFRSVSAIS
ncbi:MAG: glycosyltransferase family 4 protein [Verrucomicrobia bacterium]|nr:MAG: glycosyltransferase family 4 protein [Verrucomicrobiota bacterium]